MIKEKPEPLKLPDISRLQPGDIILSFSGGPHEWLLALGVNSNPKQLKRPLGHVEMFYISELGMPMLGGVFDGKVNAGPFVSRLSHFKHIVVYRSRQSAAEREKVANALARWVYDPKIQKAAFSHSFVDTPGKKDSFFCLSILNEAHREHKLPVPFPIRFVKANAMGRHFKEIFEVKGSEFPNIETLLTDPNYYRVLEWQNNRQTDLEHEWLAEHTARMTIDFYEQGWRLQVKKGFNLLLAVADLTEQVETFARTRTGYSAFFGKVRETWRVMKRRGQLKGLSEAEKLELVNTIGAKYRAEFFEKHISANSTKPS